MWHAFVSFNAAISRWCMYVAVAGLIGIVATVALQVFGRYVLNDTPTWAESTASC
jgi:TRAP-type transport system small permease protein